jgi:GT2 family glycosyltransferase
MNTRYRKLSHSSASGARNYGIKCSTGDILAFLDDDSVPESGWVQAIQRAVKVGPFWFRGQCIDASESNTIAHRFYTFYNELTTRDFKHQWSSFGRWKGYKMADLIQAGNFFVGRDVLASMHPVFDEHLFPFIAEGTDLSLRIRKSGHQILSVPKAKIRHYFLRLGYRSFVLHEAFWYGRALAIFAQRSRHLLGVFGHIVSRKMRRKRIVHFWNLMRGGYVLFRKKYAQNTMYNCLFLLICINYLIFLGLGSLYGTFEYAWRLRMHLLRKKP